MTIPEDYGQANLIFDGTAFPTGAEITFGLDLTVSTQTPLQVATALRDIWSGSTLPAQQVTAVRLAAVLVKFGPDDVGPSVRLGTNIPGSFSSAPSPPNTALLVQKLTDLGGRAGKGRLFMPGLADALVGAGGAIDADYLAAVQDDWSAFRTQVEATDVSLVVLHSAGSPITDPTFITGLVVQGTAATQRRRMRR